MLDFLIKVCCLRQMAAKIQEVLDILQKFSSTDSDLGNARRCISNRLV